MPSYKRRLKMTEREKEEKWLQEWLHEEEIAKIHGWDFSHIENRYSEKNNLPWDYKSVIKEHLKPEYRVLDIDTGGGEFLLSLGHPYEKTAATEGYPPNIELCSDTLLPLGIDFRPAPDVGRLPFADDSFDIVINRHGSYYESELGRILKNGGMFITQQVGALNDRELVELLLPEAELPFPEQNLKTASAKLSKAGFEIIDAQEAFSEISFTDVGALVWFARIIEWEFIGFSVKKCLPQLYEAERIIQENGVVTAKTHRYLLAAVNRKHK